MPHISYPAKVVQESLQQQSTMLSEMFNARRRKAMNKGKQKQSLAVVQTLFASLQANYGGLFTNRFANKAMLECAIDEWRVELAPYSEQVILNAYESCKHRHMNAPTLTAFSDICKMIKYTEGQPKKKEQWNQTEYGMQMAKKVRQLVRG